MWFLRRGHPLPTYPLQAVLVVDLAETGEPLARTHRLIDEVDRCTRGETTRVRQRHSSDNGLEPIALQMNQTPLVWCRAGGREQDVGRFEIAVQDPGVVSHREGPSTYARIARTYGICGCFANSESSTTTAYACCCAVCWQRAGSELIDGGFFDKPAASNEMLMPAKVDEFEAGETRAVLDTYRGCRRGLCWSVVDPATSGRTGKLACGDRRHAPDSPFAKWLRRPASVRAVGHDRGSETSTITSPTRLPGTPRRSLTCPEDIPTPGCIRSLPVQSGADEKPWERGVVKT